MVEPALKGPTQQGLAEVAAIARANVKSAVVAKAVIIEDRYALTFRISPDDEAGRQQVLDEMERALNSHRFNPQDATGIELQFD